MGRWDGLDRRRFPRVQYPCLVVLQRNKTTDMHLTHTENIGTGGVCVSLKENIKIFSTVGLEVDLLDLNDHIRCEGKVVWNVERKSQTDEGNSYFDVGVEFVGLSDKDQKRLDDIIEKFDYRKV